jgi:hypothetical protein
MYFSYRHLKVSDGRVRYASALCFRSSHASFLSTPTLSLETLTKAFTDFVQPPRYTIGGYHPAFQVPGNYPSCDRVSISWSIDSNLSVTGDAYFAITPKVAMGGGGLQAVFDLGPLNAHFDAYADFLITFNKFYFQGDVGVSIGVGFTLDLLFVSIYISCDISASLHLEGPPFGGVAHVDFWVFGFDIAFGVPNPGSYALDWAQFWNLLIQDATDSTPAARLLRAADTSAPATSPDTKFILCILDGAVPSSAVMDSPSPGTTSAPSSTTPRTAAAQTGTDWPVRSGTFRFRVETKAPFTDYTVNFLDQVATSSTGAAGTFSVKPMQVSDFVQSSMLTVTITPVEAEDPKRLSPFRPTPVNKAAPASIWAPCKSQLHTAQHFF